LKIPFLKKKTSRERFVAWREKKRQSRGQRFKELRDQIYWARFLGYVGHYQKRIVAILTLIFFASALGLALPFLSRFVLDYIVPKKDFILLNWIIVAGLGI